MNENALRIHKMIQTLPKRTIMKRILFFLTLIGCFCVILCFPKLAFQGASDGLLLWFRSIIPTLFPFVVLSNLFLSTNAVSFLTRFLGPFLSRLFHVNEHGSFAILAGFLCGYPMGAKVTADLIKRNDITKKEGAYLLSFCNNTSPMFIISYVILQNLGEKKLLIPSVCILIVSPLLCSFLFRLYYRPDSADNHRSFALQPVRFRFSYLDNAITNGFETITKVGGYMILFSIVLELLSRVPTKSIPLQLAVFPSVEITGGISFIMKHAVSVRQAYIPVMALTSFGGFCSVAQTNSMIQGAGLSIFPYLIEKLITAMVTSLISYCYLQFIPL